MKHDAALPRTPTTRLFALLGDPVAHSLSPRVQNAAFEAAAVDGVYVALRCDEQHLPGLLRGIAAAGGGGNVTVPHKERSVTLLDSATEAVRRTGACNTFWGEDARVHGDNTDVAGFRAAVRSLIGPPAGARILLLGAGGAARAAVCALLDDRAHLIVVLNRTAERAHMLREAFDPAGRRVQVARSLDELKSEGFDLVVNSTSLGLHADDALPIELDRVRRVGAVLDLVYGPAGTPWVRAARERGIVAADGREMLAHQGAESFRRWWGREAPLEAMRRAVGTA